MKIKNDILQDDKLTNPIKAIMENKEKGSIYNIHTPQNFCIDIVNKINDYTDVQNISDILVWFNLEFVQVLTRAFNVDSDKITFVTDCDLVAKRAFKNFGVNSITINIKDIKNKKMDKIMKKKFKVIIGNPPYQDDSGNIGNTLWDKFVKFSIDVCKEDGFICLVHPSKWRTPENKLWNIIKQKNLIYLEIHDINDGIKIFKTSTRYDWYILQNSDYKGKTTIKDEKGKITDINISKLIFLPNSDFELIQNLIAKDGEERLKILFSYSSYEIRKPWMSKNKTSIFKYPVVRYISASNKEIDCWYSKTKSKGHFGIKKVIFGIGSNCGSFYKDKYGEYALSQYAAGVIVDNDKELNNIYNAMSTEKFMKVMSCCMTTTQKINHTIFSLFRKDFWKEFK